MSWEQQQQYGEEWGAGQQQQYYGGHQYPDQAHAGYTQQYGGQDQSARHSPYPGQGGQYQSQAGYPGQAGQPGYPGQGGQAVYPGQGQAGPGGFHGGPGAGAGMPTLNIGSQLPLDPMVTNMAMNYGADIMEKKKKEVEGMMEKYVSIGQLKYYFAVDNSYVTRKLALLLFPFTQADWSIRYNHDEPVQPRFELNAADLYIPSMAFVTYILVVGYMLGLQERFSPEVLAATASSALTALLLEILLIYLTTTIMAISTTLAKWDTLAFCMYKYVGMIVCLVAGLLLSSSGYYPALAYTAAALALFLFRTLHLRVEPEVHGVESHGKRKLWLLFVLVGWQPLVMWWLTYSLVPSYSLPAMQEQGL